MKTINDHIHDAVLELRQKSLHDIQVETALKWTGRAIAAVTLKRPAAEIVEYAHEAVEHAALTGKPDLVVLVMHTLRDCGVPLA